MSRALKGRHEWRVYVGKELYRTCATEEAAEDYRAKSGLVAKVKRVYIRPPRLTEEQREAQALAEYARSGHCSFPIWLRVDWTKSRTWGYCPAVRWNGRKAKAGSASGCGYDKESAAIDAALCYLAPGLSAHGCGMPTLISRLRALGWELTKVGSGDTWGAYHLAPALDSEGGAS